MHSCGNEYLRRKIGVVLGTEKDIVLPVVMRDCCNVEMFHDRKEKELDTKKKICVDK